MRAYDVTFSSLLDVHAPYRVIRRSTRPSQVWYDSDCRIAKRATRALERAHRRCPTTVSLATWKNQFSIQRRLFHQKATDYWRRTIAECDGDARQLWSKLNKLIKQPTVSQFRHTKSDFAKHFTNKVNTIRRFSSTLRNTSSSSLRTWSV